MSNPKPFSKKIAKYFSDISVIVIGVAITLSVSHWLSIRSEKKDLALYLNAVQLELEENLNSLNHIQQWLEPNVRYSTYVHTHPRKSLNRDTLEKYRNVAYSLEQFYSFKNSAFEMFKNSGTMRLISDKDLLLLLWNVYQHLDGLNKALDWYFQIKTEELKKEFPIVFDGGTVDVPMWFFYVTGTPLLMVPPVERTISLSQEMLEKLENLRR